MLYETFEDRCRQWALADAYAYAHGLTAIMTAEGLHLPWDVEFIKAERCVSIAEVKHRRCKRYTFPTYKVDKKKLDEMLAEAARRRVACGLLVQFIDGGFKQHLTDVAGPARGGVGDAPQGPRW